MGDQQTNQLLDQLLRQSLKAIYLDVGTQFLRKQ